MRERQAADARRSQVGAAAMGFIFAQSSARQLFRCEEAMHVWAEALDVWLQ